jgi:hypothetical protein
MKFLSALAILAGLTPVLAEDLLFLDTLVGKAQAEAIALGYTVKTVTEAVWRTMTTADFALYKAIIIPDHNCRTSLTSIQVIDDTKAIWSPAVLGNIVVIGEFTSGARLASDDWLTFLCRYG